MGGKVFDKQSNQKSRIDKSSKERGEFNVGKQVLVQNVLREHKQTGPVSYLVRDQLRKRPVDQIYQTQIEHPDRSADAKETFPRSAGNKQIVDFGEIQRDVLRAVCWTFFTLREILRSLHNNPYIH